MGGCSLHVVSLCDPPPYHILRWLLGSQLFHDRGPVHLHGNHASFCGKVRAFQINIFLAFSGIVCG